MSEPVTSPQASGATQPSHTSTALKRDAASLTEEVEPTSKKAKGMESSDRSVADGDRDAVAEEQEAQDDPERRKEALRTESENSKSIEPMTGIDAAGTAKLVNIEHKESEAKASNAIRKEEIGYVSRLLAEYLRQFDSDSEARQAPAKASELGSGDGGMSRAETVTGEAPKKRADIRRNLESLKEEWNRLLDERIRVTDEVQKHFEEIEEGDRMWKEKERTWEERDVESESGDSAVEVDEEYMDLHERSAQLIEQGKWLDSMGNGEVFTAWKVKFREWEKQFRRLEEEIKEFEE